MKAFSSSEDIFKVLAEESPNMIFINKGGRVVYANRRCEEIMGYSRKEFYSEDFDFMILIAPEYHDLVKENFRIHMSGKDIPPYEYKLITKDGREIAAILYTKLIEYEGERAILGIVTDITEKKELIESEVKFKSLVEHSLVGVYLIQDGIFKYVNPQLAKIFGYSQEELIEKKGPRDLTYPKDWHIVKENLRKRLEGEVESINYTFRGQRKSGEVFDVEVFGSSIIYKGRPAVIGTLMDITERKRQIEEEQRRHEAFKKLDKWIRQCITAIEEPERCYDIICKGALDLLRADLSALPIIDESRKTFTYMAASGLKAEMLTEKRMPLKNGGLCGWVAEHGEPLLVKELKDDPRIDKELARALDVTTGVLTPLVQKGEVTGGISVFRKGRPFDEFDLQILNLFGQRVSIAMENMKLLTTLQQNYDIQKVLGALLHLSLEDISLEEILDRALELILSLPWLTFQPRGAIFLVEEETETLIMKTQRGLPESTKRACSRVAFGNCLCGLTATTKEIQFTDRLDKLHTIQDKETAPHGHYCVPILYKEMISGVINIHLEEGHKPLQVEKDFLTAVADTLSGIIQRKHSEKALLESEGKLKTIFNESPDVIMIVDLKEGEIKSVNRAVFKILGYFEETLIGKPFSILLRPSAPLTFDDILKELRVHKTVFESIEFIKADGGICPMDMTVNLIYWGKGMMVLVTLRDVTERVLAEKALKRRDAILESVRFAAEEFLKAGSWDKNINEILARLGNAGEVDCVFIFKNRRSEDGKLLSRILYEWVAEGIEPQIDNPELQDTSFEDKGFSRWVSMMQKGEPIYGNVKDFPESEQLLLMAIDVKSIIAVPIFVNNEWWGFIGLAAKKSEKGWLQGEIDALRAAADIIGIAIYRGEIERSLKEKLNELERFRKATIQREFRMRDMKAEIERLRRELGYK